MVPISKTTCTQAWFAAVKHLEKQRDWCDYTLVLEVAAPMTIEAGDREVRALVDGFIVSRNRHSVHTVVNTIFPAGLYKKHGGELVLKHYTEISAQIENHKDVKWGTYALRMTSPRIGKDGKSFNPLEMLIEKMKSELGGKSPKRAAYEMNLIDPVLDIPIYDSSQDRKYTRGGPCLSHLSFKLRNDHKLILTAFYRSHHYVQRGLGNLYGLAWLQHFVAERVGIKTGELVCISSMASLETGKDAGWKKREVRGLIANCTDAYERLAEPLESPLK